MTENIELLDKIIVGYVPHSIYAFSTPKAANYLKVGETSRRIPVRLKEWQNKIADLKLEDDWLAMLPKDAEKQKEFFQDFALHKYFKEKGYEPLEAQTAPGNSREFYPVTLDVIESGIEDINEDFLSTSGDKKYVYLKIEDNSVREEHWARTEEFFLRDNQQEVIDNIISVAKDKDVTPNYLLFAVMRFGKTFVALKAAKVLESKLTVVVSAKSDVKCEWKQNLESHKDFEGYVFLDSINLRDSLTAIEDALKENNVVLFLTLQDLKGKDTKEKHKQLFDKKVDLLIVDESHFGARAQSYGQVLFKSDDKENNNEVKALDNVKKLERVYTLHLSGTPYRILMGSEFSNPKQIVGKVKFEDILDEKESWFQNHLDEPEWKNPYFGFPQMVRFAFNLSDSAKQKLFDLTSEGKKSQLNELFGPLSNDKDKVDHLKFKHESYVLETLNALDGTEESKTIFPILNYDKLKEGKMAQHIVMVLPFKASCDAMAKLLIDHKNDFVNLGDYEIINIAGHDTPTHQNVKKKIADSAKNGQKTISLTVNKMLTGVTVPQWDTMVFLKDTQSPQEYDQAIYRLQSPYVIKQVDNNGNILNKEDLKPQTLLIDFAPNRMMSIEQYKAFVLTASNGGTGNDKVQHSLERQISSSPIITIDNEKLTQVQPTDILKYIAAYSSEKGIIEEASEISVDLSILDNDIIKAALETENEIGSQSGVKFGKNEDGNTAGDENDVDSDDEDNGDIETSEISDSVVDNEPKNEENSLAKKIQNYYLRILFYAFLSEETEINNLSNVVASYDNNERLARHLGIKKDVLTEIEKFLTNPWVRSDLDNKISNANALLADDSVEASEKVARAIKSFKRISESEVFTPRKVAEMMVDQVLDEIDLTDFKNRPKIFIDLASKSGIYLLVLFDKLKGKGVDEAIAKDCLYSIATSPVAYEFTRKVYELMGFPVEHILDIEWASSYDLMNVKERSYVIEGLKQYYFKGDENMKFDVVVGNPPYQERDGGSKASAKPVYNLFTEFAIEKLKSEKVCLITPSKWFAGGKGLDSYRNYMLNNNHLKVLSDYVNSKDVFNGVSIGGGVSYFLYDQNFSGECEVINHYDGVVRTMSRPLNEFSVFVRYNDAVSLLHKVNKKSKNSISDFVRPRNPFGFTSNQRGKENAFPGSVLMLTSAGDSYVERDKINSGIDIVDKYKVVISKVTSEHAGESDKNGFFRVISSNRVMPPKSICTDSYLVVFYSDNEIKANNYLLYLKTKFYRTLLMLAVSSINLSADKFQFIPQQDFTPNSDINWKLSIPEIDRQLNEKYNLDQNEIDFIESKVKAMD